MEISIKILHDGKEYDTLSDAVHAAITDGIKKILRNRLKPFEQDILKENATVLIKYKDSKTYQVILRNASDELTERVLAGIGD